MVQNYMPYRILPNGVIETDSVAEALQVQNALAGKKPRQQRGAIPKRSNDTLNLHAKQFIQALIASPTGLTTERAAAALGVQPMSIPPVVRSLNKFCQRRHVVFGKLVTRTTAYENRRQVSVYAFTAEGRTFFARHLEQTSSNGTDAKGGDGD
jgi:hypothetical protein